jgi:hypothetical protein
VRNGIAWQRAPATVTLAELLGERVAAQQIADGWYERIAADHDAAGRRTRLADLAHVGSPVQRARGDALAERLGDPIAAAAYQHLARDVGELLAAEPDLADQVLAWDDGARRRPAAAGRAGGPARAAAGRADPGIARRAAYHGRVPAGGCCGGPPAVRADCWKRRRSPRWPVR